MARYLVPKDPDRDVYETDPLDGDIENISYASPVPSPLRKLKPRTNFGGGAPVSGANMPTKLRLHGPKYDLPDLARQLSMLFVNRRVVALIERFQKEIQYFPVQLFWADGSVAGQFYFLFTTVLLDAVDREKTTKKWDAWPPGAPIPGRWDNRLDDAGTTLVFDKARMGNTHLWVDPHIGDRLIVSEALHTVLKEAGMQAIADVPKFEEI